MWTITSVCDAVEEVMPEKDAYALDEIRVGLLRDDAKFGIPVDKVLDMILWYARLILGSPDATPEEKLSTIAVIRAVEKNWPTGFNVLKGRL